MVDSGFISSGGPSTHKEVRYFSQPETKSSNRNGAIIAHVGSRQLSLTLKIEFDAANLLLQTMNEDAAAALSTSLQSQC